jgi:hypothetical protein
MKFDNDDLAASQLAEEAQRFRSRATNERRGPLKIIVSDFEFAYDMQSFRKYQQAEDDATDGWVRWPFHQICGAAWAIITFRPRLKQPIISDIAVMTWDSFSQLSIVTAYLAAVSANPDAVLHSWGGEQKDWPVVRRVAMSHGLLLPKQLTDLRPHSDFRIDLCNSTSGQARCVHLPEYATAVGIPSKPMPSVAVGSAVLCQRWDQVAKQVFGDLLTISIIAARHTVAYGRCEVDLSLTEQVIAKAFCSSRLENTFLSDADGALAVHRNISNSAVVGG